MIRVAPAAPVGQGATDQTTFSSEKLYFLNWGGGTTANSVMFQVTFKNGSPLTSQVQSFQFPGGYGGGITTPFGVPDWGVVRGEDPELLPVSNVDR